MTLLYIIIGILIVVVVIQLIFIKRYINKLKDECISVKNKQLLIQEAVNDIGTIKEAIQILLLDYQKTAVLLTDRMKFIESNFTTVILTLDSIVNPRKEEIHKEEMHG